MVSKEFCRTVRDEISTLYDEGQSRKQEFAGRESAAVLVGAIDQSVALHTQLQIENARHAGCGIQSRLSQDALRATCVLTTCPFYPNGPDSER